MAIAYLKILIVMSGTCTNKQTLFYVDLQQLMNMRTNITESSVALKRQRKRLMDRYNIPERLKSANHKTNEA